MTDNVNLTQQLIEDFRPYVKPEYMGSFIRGVHEDERLFGGPVTRIEEVPFPNGKPGIMEKRYYFGDEEYPATVLDSIRCGVDSL